MTNLLNQVVAIAIAAGQEILDVYHRHAFNVEIKGDGSPLTIADKRAHQLIEAALNKLMPQIPVLSEESGEQAFADRLGWSKFWLIDPLDGTKEFVNRNGEFSVNIALIEHNNPVLGVVHTPIQMCNHYAETGVGAFKSGKNLAATPINVRKLDPETAVMVASRSHAGAAVQAYRHNLARQVKQVAITTMGSSLKLCLVAEGKADIYPRLSPTSEWDTAAAHCVVVVAGGKVTRLNGDPLTYNKSNILNPWFLASGDSDFDWTAPALGIAEPT